MERFFFFSLWVADYVVKYGKRSRSECYQKDLRRQSIYFSMSWHIVESGRETWPGSYGLDTLRWSHFCSLHGLKWSLSYGPSGF
jgi:hypothetical protein